MYKRNNRKNVCSHAEEKIYKIIKENYCEQKMMIKVENINKIKTPNDYNQKNMKIKHKLGKSMQIIINYKLYYVCSKTA